MQIDRPSHFLQWAQETFGDVVFDEQERALRFLEEAIEVAHATEIHSAVLWRIIERVYARPRGELPLELGQCLATLELLALVVGVDADQEATAELARVKAIPKSEWTKRHGAKVAAGFAKS